MLRSLAVALALTALAGAAIAQPDPYGLPPGYEPEAPEHDYDGYPQPKEYTDADYGYAPAPQARAEEVEGYAGGYYNSASSAARSSYSYSSQSSASYESSARYEADYGYAAGGEVYAAPFAYQRRAYAYYESHGYPEPGAWSRGHCGRQVRCGQDLGALQLDSRFFSDGLTGGVEGGPPVYVGGGGGGYASASASASASAYASARAGAFARGGGRRHGGKRGCGCR